MPPRPDRVSGPRGFPARAVAGRERDAGDEEIVHSVRSGWTPEVYRHLAYMELRVILAALFWRFDLSFAGEVDDTSMEMMELWLANPCDQRLDVIAGERKR